MWIWFFMAGFHNVPVQKLKRVKSVSTDCQISGPLPPHFYFKVSFPGLVSLSILWEALIKLYLKESHFYCQVLPSLYNQLEKQYFISKSIAIYSLAKPRKTHTYSYTWLYFSKLLLSWFFFFNKERLLVSFSENILVNPSETDFVCFHTVT